MFGRATIRLGIGPHSSVGLCFYNLLLLLPPYVLGRPLYFRPVVSSFFLLFSSPNLSRRRLDVYHTSTHGLALVRI